MYRLRVRCIVFVLGGLWFVRSALVWENSPLDTTHRRISGIFCSPNPGSRRTPISETPDLGLQVWGFGVSGKAQGLRIKVSGNDFPVQSQGNGAII